MLGLKGQSAAILNHLKSGRGLTSKEAFTMYGVTRLSSHIHAFRQAGYNIITVDHVGKTRYGTTCTYGEYFLNQSEEK
jgi:hypothetical protein